ncbi:ATP-binding protein [Actinoplanes sp. CA-051413]|uniref:ATP-binding protein n=1 Tax=Actinoplanes sp. CA-051413 TaxID=3239899 RepID=UPI003D999137
MPAASGRRIIMEARPPYLFGSLDPVDPDVNVISDIDTDTVEITVRGRWNQRLGSNTYTSIRKCIAGHPATLIIDVRQMDDFWAASATMWLAANRAAGAMEPPVQLVLCVPPATPLAGKLARLGASRFLATAATPEQARTAVASHAVLTDRMQLSMLPPEPLSASAARDLVGRACDAWDMRELLYLARAVISELACNAAEHARTPMEVAVYRRATGLRLSVRDGDPRLPVLRDPEPVAAGERRYAAGQGLRIVDAAATAWGAMPTRDGKLVWATLRDNHRAGHTNRHAIRLA